MYSCAIIFYIFYEIYCIKLQCVTLWWTRRVNSVYIKHSCDTFGTIWMPYVHPIWLKCSLVSGRPVKYFYCFLTHFQPSVVFGRSTLVGYYVRLTMTSSDWRSLIFEKKKKKKKIDSKGTKIRPKTRLSQVWFITFPWNYIQWYLATMSSI